MPDNFSVDIVETDEFGWLATFKERRFFTFFADADRFVNDTNEAHEQGERLGSYIRARPPIKTFNAPEATTTTIPPTIHPQLGIVYDRSVQ
jgi:hypothetical protein